MLSAMFGWSLEPATDPDVGHNGHGDDDSDTNDPDGGTAVIEEAPVG